MDYGNMSVVTSLAQWRMVGTILSRIAVDKIRSTAFEVVSGSLDELFDLIGVPDKYKTDNGPPFHSYHFANYAANMGFAHQRITPRWPRARSRVS